MGKSDERKGGGREGERNAKKQSHTYQRRATTKGSARTDGGENDQRPRAVCRTEREGMQHSFRTIIWELRITHEIPKYLVMDRWIASTTEVGISAARQSVFPNGTIENPNSTGLGGYRTRAKGKRAKVLGGERDDKDGGCESWGLNNNKKNKVISAVPWRVRE